MAHFGGDEDQAPGGNRAVFFRSLRTSLEAGAAANYVIQFVFAMRLLVVGCSGGQDLEASAHGWGTRRNSR